MNDEMIQKTTASPTYSESRFSGEFADHQNNQNNNGGDARANAMKSHGSFDLNTTCPQDGMIPGSSRYRV